MLKHSSYFKERPDFAVKIYDAQTAYYVIRNISSFFSSFPKATWSSQNKATEAIFLTAVTQWNDIKKIEEDSSNLETMETRNFRLRVSKFSLFISFFVFFCNTIASRNMLLTYAFFNRS